MAIDSFILAQNVIMSVVIGIKEPHTSGSMLIFIWISYIIGSILKIVFYLGFHPWAELMRNDVKKVFKFRKNPTEQSPKWNICDGTNWLFNCFACKVECVRLWRIAMIYWHIEGIRKWVNSEQIFLIPTTSDYLWSSVVGVVKVDYFDFPCQIFEIMCELDVRVIAFNF